MSIPAARVGTRDPAPTASRATCCRCGITRQVNRGDNRLCGSCADEVADLGETEVWR